MTLARMRQSGLCGLAAGLIFLIGVPIYQALALVPTGFVAPDPGQPASIGQFLLWASAHSGADLGSRVVETVPFVLAVALPGPLRRILWPEDQQQGRPAKLLGQAGFALFAVVLIFGMFVAPGAAADYAAHAPDRVAIASSYAGVYGFETVLAKVVATGLIALSLAMMSLRGVATSRVPGWFSYIGLAVAGLLAATAAFTLFNLGPAAAQAQQLSYPGLALWLMLAGVLLLRIQVRPRQAQEVAAEAADPPAPAL